MEKRYVFYETGWGCASGLACVIVGASLGGLVTRLLLYWQSRTSFAMLAFLVVMALCMIPSFVVDYRLRKRNAGGER